MEYARNWRSLLPILIVIYQLRRTSAALSSCGGTLRGRTGTFTSPNYPHSPKVGPEGAAVGTLSSENSNGPIECEWKIIAPEGSEIELNFGDFDMAAGQDACNKGSLELFSGIGRSKKSVDIYCGSDELARTTIPSNSATIKFKTPADFSGKGFVASYIAATPGEEISNFISCNDQGTDLVGTGSYRVLCPGGCADIMVIWGNSVYRDNSYICKAAVHNGAIADALGGVVEVKKLPGDLFYWGTEANGVISEAGSLSAMKIEFVRPDADCNSLISLQKDQLSASSYWTDDEQDEQATKWTPGNAILGKQVDAWSPNDPTSEQWLQVDLGESKVITGIVTRGSSDRYYKTKLFRIAYKHDLTSQWVFYREQGFDSDKVFLGSENTYKNATNNFIQPRIVTRFLRVYPTPVDSQRDRYSLQIALFGCDAQATAIRDENATTPPQNITKEKPAVGPGSITESTTPVLSKVPPGPPIEEGIGENSIIIIAIVAALSVTSILLAALVLFLVKKRKKEPKDLHPTRHPLQDHPDNNHNIRSQYRDKKSRKTSRKTPGEHFQNADYKDTLLQNHNTTNIANQALLPNGTFAPNGMMPQKPAFQPAEEDSFSDDDEDHEYQVIDDGQVAANINKRGSSKASTGSSMGNHSRKSDTTQQMWGVDGSQWHNPGYPLNSPMFPMQGPQMNGHAPLTSFSANPQSSVTFFPKTSHLSRNHTFSHEARYSAGDAPSHPANLRRGNSQSPSRMQRHSSSSNNSSHSYPINGFYPPPDPNGPYYSSVPTEGTPVALNHVMYGRETIPEQKEINPNRRAPSYKVPRSLGSELPALPDQNGVTFAQTSNDPTQGSFSRTGLPPSRTDYDRLYRNNSAGGADTMNTFSIANGSHSQYDQLNLNNANL